MPGPATFELIRQRFISVLTVAPGVVPGWGGLGQPGRPDRWGGEAESNLGIMGGPTPASPVEGLVLGGAGLSQTQDGDGFQLVVPMQA